MKFLCGIRRMLASECSVVAVFSRRAVLFGGTSLAAVLSFSEPSVAADLFGELRSRLEFLRDGPP